MSLSRSVPSLCSVLVLVFGTAGCGGSSPGAAGAGARSSSSVPGPTATASVPARPALGYAGIPLESGPDLAPPSTTVAHEVNGISCGASEQLAHHVHAHLLVFVHGAPRALPAGVGIPGSVVETTAVGPIARGGRCILWLHTHTTDGVIHVEAPGARRLTLGDFFAEWRQPLGPTQVAGAIGPVVAWVDGLRWPGNPRAIPLRPHAVIQLDVGSPAVAFRALSWAGTNL